MADITKREFNINVSYSAGTTTVIWSSENQGISGKITAITLDLVNHSISTHNGMLLAHSVLNLHSRSSLFDEQIIECDKRYIGNQKIEFDNVRKVYSGSKLVNNGKCIAELKIVTDNDLRGDISGTITVSYTEDVEEQNSKTVLGLNQNALTDWLKDQTSGKVKTGVSATNQYPIDLNFSSGKSQVLVWTNKGVNSDYIESISISLQLDVTNEASSQRTIDLDFNAAYGSESENDNIGMWILSAGQSRTINTAKTYEVTDMVNDGLCVITIILKNTENVSGILSGVVILKTKSAGISETGSSTTDTSIQNVLDMLNSDDYSVGGSIANTGLDVDSFLSKYSGEGYEDDMSLLSSDSWNSQAMSNDMGGKILSLEQRVTNLEERMNILNVGGTDIDWYDGGADGSDVWGIDEWYKQNESRINQVENDENVSCSLFETNNISRYARYNPNNQKYEVSLSVWAFLDEEKPNKSYKSFDYTLLFSFNGNNEVAQEFRQYIVDNSNLVYIVVGNVEQGKKYPLYAYFAASDDFISTEMIDSFKCTEMLPILDDNKVEVCFKLLFEADTMQKMNEINDYVTDVLNRLHQVYLNSGKVFAKITGNLSYVVTDYANEQVVQTANVDYNLFTDQSNLENKFYVVNPESVNKTIERVDYNFTFSYQYTGTACNGKKLTLYVLSKRYDGAKVDKDTSLTVTLDLSNKQFSKVVQGAIIREKDFLMNNGNSELDFCLSDKEISSWTQAEKTDILNNFQGKILGTVKYTLS